jgi:hypothetical protein
MGLSRATGRSITADPMASGAVVDNELQVLIDTGVTLIHAAFRSQSNQTRIVNSIYYARGRPGQLQGARHWSSSRCRQVARA